MKNMFRSPIGKIEANHKIRKKVQWLDNGEIMFITLLTLWNIHEKHKGDSKPYQLLLGTHF
jgi:hypothetical protein